MGGNTGYLLEGFVVVVIRRGGVWKEEEYNLVG
jgi:hypothetical protein